MRLTHLMLRGLSLLLLAAPVQAAQEFLLPAPDQSQRELVIYSATDYQHLQPLLLDFQQANPDLSIRFVDMNSQELNDRFLAEGQASPADLLLSSAMDLQLKLVNDGHARPWRSSQTLALPARAHWRHELFAFTFEPVLTVFNRQLLGPHPLPRSRQELLALMRRDPGRFRGRIATYDITTSGVGYLLASQDSQQGETYGRLLEAFGSLSIQLESRTNDMLAALARGELILGYNLLGSYVTSALARHPQLVALAPEDYTLMLMRLALIPNSSPAPEAAGAMLDFMLSARGQDILAGSGLPPLLDQDSGEIRLAEQGQGPVTLIPLSPVLLPPRDPLVRQHFIDAWSSSITAPTTGPAP